MYLCTVIQKPLTIMKHSNNEIFVLIAQAVTNRSTERLVIYFENGDSMLVDFANSDGSEFETDTVCVWSLQREIRKNGEYCGTEELDCGAFVDYRNVHSFLRDTLREHEGTLLLETY